MSNIHIRHEHELGLKKARKVAKDWMGLAEQKLSLSCDYREGKTHDIVSFERSGVSGQMTVRADEFEVEAKLGFLFSAFKDKIESEIVQTLESRLQAAKP
jgi:putative polyhydroxyalkanoate system protein